MGTDLKAGLAFIAFAGLLVAALVSVNVFLDWNTNPLKLAADIVPGVATVAAIVIGGVFAWRNLWWLRTFQPHMTITHSVSHRPVGTQYIHLAVFATLYNSSQVKVEIQEGVFQLAQVSPVEDDQLLSMYRSAFPLSNERKRWEHKRQRNGDLNPNPPKRDVRVVDTRDDG